MKKLVCIVGMPGSGKTYLADIIAKKYKAKHFHSGDIIREEIKRRGLEYSPHADMVIAHWFHTHGRDKIIVERLWNKIKKSKKRLILVEGFRSESEVNYLRELSGIDPIVIAVTAPFKIRLKRELKRGRFGEEESKEYIKSRDNLEISHGIKKLIANADYKVENLGKKGEKKILKLVRKI